MKIWSAQEEVVLANLFALDNSYADVPIAGCSTGFEHLPGPARMGPQEEGATGLVKVMLSFVTEAKQEKNSSSLCSPFL